MAVSGTVSTTIFTTRQVIDHAYRRCRLPPSGITADMLQLALADLYLFLSELANQGAPLWRIQKNLIPLYQNQAIILSPLGTNDVLNVNERRTNRVTGAYTSSAGGTVSNAFDDDFDTILTQTSINGNVSVNFGSDTLITSVGYLPGATSTLNLVWERSADNVTWTTCYASGSQVYTNNVWQWFDIDGNLEDQYFRVRETGGGTIVAREIFFGNNPAEVPMSRLNRDDFTAFPNRTATGRPVQFWYNRQREYPQFEIYPVTDQSSRYDIMVAWLHMYIQDVGTLTQTLDIPQRWYWAVVNGLAHMLAGETPEVDVSIESKLAVDARNSLQQAQAEERDNSPIFIQPQIGAYTR